MSHFSLSALVAKAVGANKRWSKQWAVNALNDPNARRLIEPYTQSIYLSKDAFPQTAIRGGNN